MGAQLAVHGAPDLVVVGKGKTDGVDAFVAQNQEVVRREIVPVAVAIRCAGKVIDGELLAPEIDPRMMVEVGKYAICPPELAVIPKGLSSREAAALILARAASTSPSSINEITISTVIDHLTPAQIVETVVWLSVLQMLHRLYAYYDARIGLI